MTFEISKNWDGVVVEHPVTATLKHSDAGFTFVFTRYGKRIGEVLLEIDPDVGHVDLQVYASEDPDDIPSAAFALWGSM